MLGCLWNQCSCSKPGTYLIESGTHPSIQGPMGLYGILVVTAAPAGATPGTAYPAVGTTPAVTYNAEVPLLFSEIDPVQNNAVQAAVTRRASKRTTVWSGQPGKCGDPASATHHLLSAGGKLHAALLPDQRRGVQQERKRLSVRCYGGRNAVTRHSITTCSRAACWCAW